MRVKGLPVLVALMALLSSRAPASAGPYRGPPGPPPCAPAGTALVCRLDVDRTPSEVERRLAEKAYAYWIDGDVISVAARRPGDWLRLCCTFQMPMRRVGEGDLWTVSLKVGHLDQALIDVTVIGPGDTVPPGMMRYRGVRAPGQPPYARRLAGHIQTLEVASATLGTRHKLSAYLPPGFDPRRRYPVVYMADGDATEELAHVAEALITSGRTRPFVIVGLWTPDQPETGPDLRAQEYVRGVAPEVMARHQDLLVNEVLPTAQTRLGASPDAARRMLFGSSAGGGWAITSGSLHPELFGWIAAASPVNEGAMAGRPSPRQRYLLGAGLFEAGEPVVRRNLDALTTAGARTHYFTAYAGHSPQFFELFFADAVTRAFPGPRGR